MGAKVARVFVADVGPWYGMLMRVRRVEGTRIVEVLILSGPWFGELDIVGTW